MSRLFDKRPPKTNKEVTGFSPAANKLVSRIQARLMTAKWLDTPERLVKLGITPKKSNVKAADINNHQIGYGPDAMMKDEFAKGNYVNPAPEILKGVDKAITPLEKKVDDLIEKSIEGTKINSDLEEIGTPMLSEAKYQAGNGVTWCNTYCMDLAKKVLGRNPFKDDTDEAKWGINTYGMEKYVKAHPEQWQTITNYEEAWKKINAGSYIVFFSNGHVATGIPTTEGEMKNVVIRDKPYSFGNIIQAGKTVKKCPLWEGFGKTLVVSGIRIYMYTGVLK